MLLRITVVFRITVFSSLCGLNLKPRRNLRMSDEKCQKLTDLLSRVNAVDSLLTVVAPINFSWSGEVVSTRKLKT